MARKWTASAIKKLRKRLGHTQEVFAKRVGVSWVTVSRWENGRSVPRGLSAQSLDALAKRVR